MEISNRDVNDILTKVRQQPQDDQTLSVSLRTTIELLIALIQILTGRLGTDSANSSKPPSLEIVIDGTPEQKARYLPLMASGELIGSFALTEPDAGSDARSVATTARRDGDYYNINGNNRYITNAPRGGVFTMVLVKRVVVACRPSWLMPTCPAFPWVSPNRDRGGGAAPWPPSTSGSTTCAPRIRTRISSCEHIAFGKPAKCRQHLV